MSSHKEFWQRALSKPKEYEAILIDGRLCQPLGLTKPTHVVIDKVYYDKAIKAIKSERTISMHLTTNATFERLTKALYDLGEL